MDSSTLEFAAKSDDMISKYWNGVFSKDTVPPLHGNQLYVINTDSSQGPGEHWLGLSTIPHDGDDRGEFFDSFGNDLATYDEISAFVKSYYPRVKSNHKQLQLTSTKSCGLFVLFDLYCAARQIGMDEMVERFFSKPATKASGSYKYELLIFHFISCVLKFPQNVDLRALLTE